MAENKLPVAVVTGVGPGLGAALARRFAKGYAVAINARTPDFIALSSRERFEARAARCSKCLPISAILRKSPPCSRRSASASAARGPALQRRQRLVGHHRRHHARAVRERLARQCPRCVRQREGGRARYDRARARRDAVHRRYRRSEGGSEVGIIRAGEVRDARAGAVARARPRSQGNPRRMDQRRRLPSTSQAASLAT